MSQAILQSGFLPQRSEGYSRRADLASKQPDLGSIFLQRHETDKVPVDPIVAGALCHWLSRSEQPILVADGDLIVHWTSAAAQQRLGSDWGLALHHRRLVHSDPASNDTLARRLQSASDGAISICLPSVRAGEHLLIKAQRINGLDEFPLFVLTVARTGERVKPYAHVTEVFGLTQSETRVLNALAQGKTAEDAACAAGVKIETVRTQIKNIYAKVGVNSREALLHRLLPFQA